MRRAVAYQNSRGSCRHFAHEKRHHRSASKSLPSGCVRSAHRSRLAARPVVITSKRHRQPVLSPSSGIAAKSWQCRRERSAEMAGDSNSSIARSARPATIDIAAEPSPLSCLRERLSAATGVVINKPGVTLRPGGIDLAAFVRRSRHAPHGILTSSNDAAAIGRVTSVWCRNRLKSPAMTCRRDRRALRRVISASARARRYLHIAGSP